ncbi:hypothetical protein BS78_K304000 [Paspalum vaginatum]|uniref:CCHC-type domain-containing protein n=1 Tax=Paspalum vaginatum TaxID=158149 RepID=A0A9W7XDZ6_9POAL|nr:hypothetical protein BS78_K304000 [Paspalum vaginatum]
MESEIQLTTLQKSRSGSASSTGGDQKRAQQEGGEHSQPPPPKKSKPNQQFHQPQSFKSKQPGGQSSSASRPMGSQFLRPVPGKGLICFKCGKPHHSSECHFTRVCNRCGKDGHMSIVCKRNPDSIIKWQKYIASSVPSGSSHGSVPSVAATRGSVQMMATLTPYQQYPQQYVPLPPGYYWPPPQLPTPHVPHQLSAPHAPL